MCSKTMGRQRQQQQQLFHAQSSWVPIPPGSHFSLANLPFGIISTKKSGLREKEKEKDRARRGKEGVQSTSSAAAAAALTSDPGSASTAHTSTSSASSPTTDPLSRRPAVAIGEQVLDLREFTLRDGFAPLFAHLSAAEQKKLVQVFTEPGQCETLNAFAALGRPCHRLVRTYLQRVFSAEGMPAVDKHPHPGPATETMPVIGTVPTMDSDETIVDPGVDSGEPLMPPPVSAPAPSPVHFEDERRRKDKGKERAEGPSSSKSGGGGGGGSRIPIAAAYRHYRTSPFFPQQSCPSPIPVTAPLPTSPSPVSFTSTIAPAPSNSPVPGASGSAAASTTSTVVAGASTSTSTSSPKAVLRDDPAFRAAALLPQSSVEMHLPMRIGDYTDFYAGINHATNVGILFRGRDKALQPNYRHLPVGYHGRASSVVVSGKKVVRPVGQILSRPKVEVSSSGPSSSQAVSDAPAATGASSTPINASALEGNTDSVPERSSDSDVPAEVSKAPQPSQPSPPSPRPILGPTEKLDFELELGAFVCRSRNLGDRPLTVDEASASYLFGIVLLNDWSARDIQAWEYVPLGPFTAKNFATTVSPWVVLMDALEPFAVEGEGEDEDGGENEPQDGDGDMIDSQGGGRNEDQFQTLPYLLSTEKGADNSRIDIELEVSLTTKSGNQATVVKTSSRHLVFSFAQMLAHHTVTGCNIQTGDLLGSGTISGPVDGDRSGWGSLLEQTKNGAEEIVISAGDGIECADGSTSSAASAPLADDTAAVSAAGPTREGGGAGNGGNRGAGSDGSDDSCVYKKAAIPAPLDPGRYRPDNRPSSAGSASGSRAGSRPGTSSGPKSVFSTDAAGATAAETDKGEDLGEGDKGDKGDKGEKMKGSKSKNKARAKVPKLQREWRTFLEDGDTVTLSGVCRPKVPGRAAGSKGKRAGMGAGLSRPDVVVTNVDAGNTRSRNSRKTDTGVRAGSRAGFVAPVAGESYRNAHSGWFHVDKDGADGIGVGYGDTDTDGYGNGNGYGYRDGYIGVVAEEEGEEETEEGEVGEGWMGEGGMGEAYDDVDGDGDGYGDGEMDEQECVPYSLVGFGTCVGTVLPAWPVEGGRVVARDRDRDRGRG